MMARLALLLAVLVSVIGAPARSGEPETPSHRLAGFAMLDAETFVDGPTSAQFVGKNQEPIRVNGIATPFEGRQPLQGFSGLVRHPDGGFIAVSDNGFGAQTNSADYLLRLVHLLPDFRTVEGGRGDIQVLSTVVLNDADRRIGFPIVADMDRYPNGNGTIPVDTRIRESRLLTGFDFDLESICRMPDGTFWLGDEFGPFLLHVDGRGRLLQAPVPLPGVFSPQSPELGDATANASPSGGFEGMAARTDGSMLYPMLEKRLAGESPHLLPVYAFDPRQGAYVSEVPVWRYRLESPDHRIGAFRHLIENRYLIIERDDYEGRKAQFKRIFLVDLEVVDDVGAPLKRHLVDLLHVPDPDGIGGQDSEFSFPFVTPESLIQIDDRTIGVLNDNNFPFSRGRFDSTHDPEHPEGQPDDNEFILIRFDDALADIPVVAHRD
jgi:hypothetical protein